ncbi:MAG: 4'-phosphopantetheinyl transferase family protein [Pseudonocardia sp.]
MPATSPPCTVWWAAPVDPAERPGLLDLLDEHERERFLRFHRAADRARYLAAHALVRLVLGDLLGSPPAALELDRTCRCGQQHGKPRLLGVGAPGFSLTHAGALVGVAVRPDDAVGLDVEHVRELTDLAGMARHVQSPAELARRCGSADAPAFFTAWTRKEALLKATGDGLSTPMSTITLSPTGAAVQTWIGEGAPDGPVWLRDLRPAPGYAAAVAGPGAIAPVVLEADGNVVLRAGA